MAVEINGDGLITVDGTSTTQGRVRLKEDTDNGSNYVELTAPASVTANRTITFPDDTGTVLTNSGNQTGVFSALTVNSNNISADNSLGFRNRIINGDMRIDQRNAGASSASNLYTMDRWFADSSQSAKYTIQQNAGSVTPPAGFTNYLGVTSSSAYSVLTGDYFTVQQYIEGFNVADLGWGTANAKTVTLSFWVRSSLTGTFGGALKNSAENRSYPFTYTISAANTWEQKSITIVGDTTGTWLTNNGRGISLFFGLGVGSTYSGTAGAWAGSNFASATGATSVVGTNGATFYITGVQLEVGSTATPFERRPYGTELMLCQRYCQVRRAGEGSNTQITFCGTGNARSTTAAYFSDKFATTMRAFPSLTVVNATSFQIFDTGATAVTSIIYDISDRDYMLVNANVASGLTSTRFYTLTTGNGQTNGVLIYSAEL